MVPFSVAQTFFAKAKENNDEKIQLHPLTGGSHLDVGRWIYQQDKQRELVLDFVEACLKV